MPMTEAPELVAADLPIDPENIPVEPPFATPDVGQSIIAPEEDDETQQALEDLDARARDDFTGLMRLGYLEDECEIAGHLFHLRTPTHDERLERGALHREHIGTLNYSYAWELLTVAAYVVEIDGVPAPEPLGPKGIGPVSTRYRWIKETIASPVMITKLFRECSLLDARETAVVEYLDDQSKA